MTAREPSAVEVSSNEDSQRLSSNEDKSAVEVIAEHFGCGRGEFHEGYGNVCKSSAHAPAMFRDGCEFVANLLAALKAAGFVVATRDEIRAMSVQEQAELIGGVVREGSSLDGSTFHRLEREVQP